MPGPTPAMMARGAGRGAGAGAVVMVRRWGLRWVRRVVAVVRGLVWVRRREGRGIGVWRVGGGGGWGFIREGLGEAGW